MRIFQIFDTVGKQVIGPIMTARHEAAAVRHFTDALSDKTNILGAHPQDFELLDLGNQDDETGQIDPLDKPEVVITGKHWVSLQGSQSGQP